MQKWVKSLSALTLAGAITVSAIVPTQAAELKKEAEKPKNVIMLVMDGSSDNVSTISRWYKGEPLALDSILTGAARTYSAESAITDSAPAATALATGNKSNSGYVGVLPSKITMPGVKGNEANAFKPVANVLEGAKLQGKATGVISTSEIQHATPAGFSAHATSRSNYDDIAEQQVYQNIDVVLGGGYNSLKDTRKDGENLIKVLEERKYDIVQTREEMLNSTSDKLWGSFAPSALAYDFDRETLKPEQPTLAEMTEKAIDTLSKDEDGFFLMVEGSKIDWAAHANDTIGMISDFLSFDDAVAEAIEFAEKDGNTLVIAVTDHGNSGITIGNHNTTGTYDKIDISAYINPLKEAKLTVEGALSLLKEDRSNIEEVAGLYGLTNLTAEERAALEATKSANELGQVMISQLANRANIGYTTGGHTGDDVFLYSFGPNKLTGLVDNTDIARAMADFMDFDLETISKQLFVNATDALAEKGFTVTIDKSDETNPKLIAKKGNTTYTLDENKNTVLRERKLASGRVHKLTKTFNSVHFYNDQHFYISEEVINYMK